MLVGHITTKVERMAEAAVEEKLKNTCKEKWLLTEPSNLDDLLIPIKLNKSVQFTSIDVSKDFIWCGSSRANLYVFDRYTLKHVYLVPVASNSAIDCSITHVDVYKSQQLCASANYNGGVFISRIQSGTSLKPESFEAISLSTTVTQLIWHTDAAKLYIGDNTGVIYLCSILTSKVIPRTSKLCKLDSCIVQLHFQDSLLLASTLTRCTLYHTERKTCSDVGTKPRHGCYGAVLLPEVQHNEDGTMAASDIKLECYCARPGFRLWKADIDGKVLATLNFKQGIAECRSSAVIGSKSVDDDSSQAYEQTTLNAFPYLMITRDRLIVSLANESLYVINPYTSGVVLSTRIIDDVVSSCISGKSIFLLTSFGEVRCIELTTLLEHIEALLDTRTISKAIKLCLDNQDYVMSEVMMLVRIHEIVSPEDLYYKEFMSVFGSKRAEYQNMIDNRSSRSNTVSSVSSSRSLRSNSVTSANSIHSSYSVNSTDTPLGTGTDTPPGTITDTPPGTGTDTPLGTGTGTPLGTGTDTPPGTVTDTPPGTGTDTPLGTGTGAPPDAHTDTPPCTGTDTPPCTGTDTPPCTGTDTPLGTSTDASPGARTGALLHVGTSTDSTLYTIADTPSATSTVHRLAHTFGDKQMDGFTDDLVLHDDNSSEIFYSNSTIERGQTSTPTLGSSNTTIREKQPSSVSLISIGSFSDVGSDTIRLDTSSPRSGSITGSPHSRGNITYSCGQKSSTASISSFEQSEDYSEDSRRKSSRGRRIRTSTIDFSPEKDQGNADDALATSYQNSRSIPIRMPADGSLRDTVVPSPSSYKNVGKEHSPSPKTMFREISSPGAVVGQVKDHVKDGLAKISSQAKNIISSIKEKAISQPAIEKFLSSGIDSSSEIDGGIATPGELSEDSGSHHTFFIGDDEINMNDDMPSSLGVYLDLTLRTYRSLIDPFQLLDSEEVVNPQLETWSRSLSLLLSQYSHMQQRATGATDERRLRYMTKVCPWRMSSEQTTQSAYLATMCVLRGTCDVMSEYAIERPDSLQAYHIDISQHSSVVANIGDVPEGSIQSVPCSNSDDSDSVTTEETECDILTPSIEMLDKIPSVATANHVTQFLGTFWFLVDKTQLCTHVENLSNRVDIRGICGSNDSVRVTPTTSNLHQRQRDLWTAVINCLTESKAGTLEWRSIYNQSLFATNDMRKQIMKSNSKPDLWLYVYLLLRQNKFEDAFTVALNAHAHIPPLHIMYSLLSTCDSGDLPLIDTHEMFAKYAQSMIELQNVSKRSQFVCERFSDTQVLSFWLDSLKSVHKSSSDRQALCSCGMPSELQKEAPTINLQINFAAVIHLLETAFGHLEHVMATILLIGGSMASLRQKIRDNDRQSVIRLLLLSNDISELRLYLGGLHPTNEDCLYLLNQRARQERDDSDDVFCNWCESVCVTPHPLLPWDSIAEAILEWLGPAQCLDVLTQSSLPTHSVTREFFSKCVNSHRTNLNSSRMVADVIDGLEKFLWSNELSDKTVDPALYLLMSKEVEMYKQSRDGEQVTDTHHHQLMEMSNSFKQQHSLRTLEESEVHWGREVSLDGECLYCGLPLLYAKMNVTIFQCGHMCHQSCQPSKTQCKQCTSK